MISLNEKEEEFITKYERDRPDYVRLVEEVEAILAPLFSDDRVKITAITGRAKTIISLREKLDRKDYSNPESDVTDLAAARVVCSYKADALLIKDFIEQKFKIINHSNKEDDLDHNLMGYQGEHYLVKLGENYKGGRYERITDIVCEIQVRTILQDAWAIINHQLAYKKEELIPKPIRREINNVSSLLEVAQLVFDGARGKIADYIKEIKDRTSDPELFLSQPIDTETLKAYSFWKFPDLPASDWWTLRMLYDLDRDRYKTLKDIDKVVAQAAPAVDKYQDQNPAWFASGTDFITKSLGFVDLEFRKKHPWGAPTIAAFKQFEDLVK